MKYGKARYRAGKRGAAWRSCGKQCGKHALPPKDKARLESGFRANCGCYAVTARYNSSVADKPALVSLTFDDGLRCQFERAVPILDQYGLPATFFVIANEQPKHENQFPKIEWHERDTSMLRELARRGHEIGSHTVNHLFPTVQNLEHSEYEARKSKRWIEERMSDVEIPSFAYPFYCAPEPLKNAVINAGYKQARGGPLNYRNTPPQGSLEWFEVECHEISDNEDVKGWVPTDCWRVLTFHGIGTVQDGWAPITVVEFSRQMTELAKLRNSGAVEVVTFKDGADRLRRL